MSFEKSALPSEVLAQVWNLADIEQRGALNVTEFIIAMHLLASYKSKALSALPPSIPDGLYEAATRRPGSTFAPRPVSVRPADASIPRQSSGPGPARGPERQFTGPSSDWLITPRDKLSFDDLFSKVDTLKLGYISGEQAVSYFSDSGLASEVLAHIWDLANIRRLGQLNKDEFAVAMYLIRNSRGKLPSDLPTVLQPSLIPPSLRGVAPTTLPPAPAAPAPPTALPKSNADDLFGLDALTSSPSGSVQQQTTGGSAALPRATDDPFRQQSPPAVAPHPSSAAGQSIFQTFAPQSSFGQILSSQRTADSTSSGPRQASAVDDLLGDNDPEISNKLTKDTSDLGNMSNEMSNLRNQMQTVKAKKSVTENELVGSSAQKKDMEARLLQFRTQYEQELNMLKAFEVQLATERGEVTKLGQQIALVQASHQDVKAKLRDVQLSLDTTLREKEDVNQRIRQLNEYINQAKSELADKQSQLRQQTGRTAISKKQAEKLEEERAQIDKAKAEEPAARSAQPSRPLPTREATATSATSMNSTNPFMRRAPQPPMDNTTSPSAFSPTISLDGSKFENIFSTAFATPTSSTAPSTSFRADVYSRQSGPSINSEPNFHTPSTSPPRSPQLLPPPASRQMTSKDLPMAERVRPGSNSTSVRVESPVSRYDISTPTNAPSSPPAQGMGRSDPPRSVGFDRAVNAASAAVSETPKPAGKGAQHADIFQSLPSARDSQAPTNEPSNALPQQGGSVFADRGKDNAKAESPAAARSDPFYAPGHSRPSTGSKGDIEAAFASVGRSQAGGSGDDVAKFNSEFPPLKGKDEFPPIEEAKRYESESESEAGGFEDDFTKPSPSAKNAAKDRGMNPSGFGKESDGIFGKTAGELDGPHASKAEKLSSVSQGEALFGGSKGSNTTGASTSADNSTFPATPSETNRTSNPSDSYRSAVSHQSFGGGGSADNYSSPAEQPTLTQSGIIGSVAPKLPSTLDDFSTGFDDLAPAKEAVDPAEDDLLFDPSSEEHEFSASFDSPSASMNKSGMTERPAGSGLMGASSKMTPFSSDDHGFERAFAKSAAQPSLGDKKPHSDWDDLVRGVKADGPMKATSAHDFGPAAFPEAPEAPSLPRVPEPPSMPRAPESPGMSRADERDDPFLKHLVQMGYARPKALEALEKFDYDIQKVRQIGVAGRDTNISQAGDYLASPIRLNGQRF